MILPEALTTGKCLKPRSIINTTACDTLVSGTTVVRLRVMMSDTGSCGLLALANTRVIMSRSVTMPCK